MLRLLGGRPCRADAVELASGAADGFRRLAVSSAATRRTGAASCRARSASSSMVIGRGSGQNGEADRWQSPACQRQRQEGHDAQSLAEHTFLRPASSRQHEDPRDKPEDQGGFAPEQKHEHFKACHGMHLDEKRLKIE